MNYFLTIVLFVLLSPSFSFAAILANISGKPIDDIQIKSEYEQMTDSQKTLVNKDLTARKTIVDNAINTEVLFQEAKRIGLEKDQSYNRALERFKRQYLATKILEKTIEPKLVTSSVKKYFESNKNLFDTSEVCAYHIVVSDENLAKTVATEANKKDAKFDELAKKYSIDPTVQENKGDLGCFTRERMVSQFSEAVFSMKKDEIRGPVITPYGYHVMKVYNIKQGSVPNFEQIEQRIKDTYRLKLMRDMISELRVRQNVKVNEEEVKKFKL